LIRLLFLLLVSVLLVQSCATLNRTELNSVERVKPDSLVLLPMLDVFEERVDVIREKTNADQMHNEQGETVVPYHSVGFYLGNGLFYDLNGNLSLLPLKLLDLSPHKTFRVELTKARSLLNNSVVIDFDGHTLEKRVKSGIGFAKSVDIEIDDSLIVLRHNRITSLSFQQNAKGSYKYEKPLGGRHIELMENGFYIKQLLGKRTFVKQKNELYLEQRIVVKQKSTMIEVYSVDWGSERLRFQIIFADDAMFIYSKRFTGYKIEFVENGVNIYENQRLKYQYQIVQQ
jgi:hypothetical protein